MDNNHPNKLVSQYFKEFMKLREVKEAVNYDYKAETVLKEKLNKLTRVVGGIEVMSKINIPKLVKMQSCLRFMAEHSFYIQFASACDCLTKTDTYHSL